MVRYVPSILYFLILIIVNANMYQFIGLSKLAQVYWTRELARRLSEEGSSIIALTLHPGVIYTGSYLIPPTFI